MKKGLPKKSPKTFPLKKALFSKKERVEVQAKTKLLKYFWFQSIENNLWNIYFAFPFLKKRIEDISSSSEEETAHRKAKAILVEGPTHDPPTLGQQHFHQ